VNVVVASLVSAAAVLAARWGYRRGAAALLRGWSASLAALVAGCVAGQLAWAAAATVSVAIVTGVAVMLLCGAAMTWRLRARLANADHRAGPAWCNRIAGAGLALLYANICCMALAFVSGTVVFSESVWTDDDAPDQPVAAAWVGVLSDASWALSQVSDMGLLGQIPRVDEYHREMRALVALLNASPASMQRLVEQRHLMRFYDLPAVRAALDDHAYLELIERARRGEVRAVIALVDSPHTRAIIQCPQIREFAATVTPSQLLAELQAADQATADASPGE
jgi:hypothetical protein